MRTVSGTMLSQHGHHGALVTGPGFPPPGSHPPPCPWHQVFLPHCDEQLLHFLSLVSDMVLIQIVAM